MLFEDESPEFLILSPKRATYCRDTLSWMARRQARRAGPGMRTRTWKAHCIALGVAFLLVSITLGITPPTADASVPVPIPSLSVQPTSGPVGTLVTVHDSEYCEPPGFGQFGNLENASLVGNASVVRYVIPAFVGEPAVPVTKGDFEFGATCQTPLTSSGYTNIFVRFTVTGGASPERFVGMASMPNGDGYWLAQGNGGVYSFGGAHFFGSLPGLGVVPTAPITGIVSTTDGGGYWLVGADGGVFAFGDAVFHGSLPDIGVQPIDPIVGIAATNDGGGYWLSGADGGIFAFGDAPYCWSSGPALFEPAFPPPWPGTLFPSGLSVAIATYPESGGYATVSSLGGGTIDPLAQPCDLSSFGFLNSYPTVVAPVVGIAAAQNGGNTWEAGGDGGVFAASIYTQFSNSPTPRLAPFYGSLPELGITPAAPIVGISATPDGGGYWLVGADGGVYAFGDAVFYGSAA